MELIFAGILGLLAGAVASVASARIPKAMHRGTENFVALVTGNVSPHEPYPVLSLGSLANLFPLSMRTGVICVVSALLSALAIASFGVTPRGVAVLSFTYILVTLFVIDVEAQLLPDSLTYPLMWLGLLVNLEGTFVVVNAAIVGAVAGYIVLWLLACSFKAVTKIDGMGNGDFKLLAAMCAWHGYQALSGVLFFAFIVGIAAWLIRAFIARERTLQPFAFGPYLAVAGLAAFYTDAFKAVDLFGF